MISTCVLLLNAGHEATVHTIANGVKTLLEKKTPVAALEPTAIESTVEEILRFDPPLHKFTRYVYEDTTVSGVELTAGTEIGCLLAAANRDPHRLARRTDVRHHAQSHEERQFRGRHPLLYRGRAGAAGDANRPARPVCALPEPGAGRGT